MTLKLELQVKRFQLTPRAHARLMREINRRVMERQRDERVPLHFDVGAYSKYRARQRSTSYNAAKMRLKGHIKPNVRTGYLKKSLRFKITATQHGSRLIIAAKLNTRLPKDEWDAMTKEQQAKWLRKNQRRLAKWQKEEIARLAPSEIKQERKRMAEEYRRGALSTQYKRKRAKRIK